MLFTTRRPDFVLLKSNDTLYKIPCTTDLKEIREKIDSKFGEGTLDFNCGGILSERLGLKVFGDIFRINLKFTALGRWGVDESVVLSFTHRIDPSERKGFEAQIVRFLLENKLVLPSKENCSADNTNQAHFGVTHS